MLVCSRCVCHKWRAWCIGVWQMCLSPMEGMVCWCVVYLCVSNGGHAVLMCGRCVSNGGHGVLVCGRCVCLH